MAKIVGIVNFEQSSVDVQGLSEFRTIPAMSIFGRYRIIDFVLSNMVNSGIDHINVLVKDKARSLVEHVSGTDYNINSKRGELRLLYSDKANNNPLYFTDVALLKQYMDDIEATNAEYVVIAPSYMLARIDYSEVVKQHEASGADITVVYKHVDNADVSFLNGVSLVLDGTKVKGATVSRGENPEANISMHTFVMSMEVFTKIIEKAGKESALFYVESYISSNLKKFDLQAYEYKGYLRCINSLEEYYQTNIEIIDRKKATELFDKNWPIYTKTNDSSPSFYSTHSNIKNSLIANGCNIHGTIENCILGRSVYVESGAVVKNAVILPGAYIGKNAVIDTAVIDKGARVTKVKTIVGEDGNIAYVARKDVV